MKRFILFLFNLLLLTNLSAQKVELLISTDEVYEKPRMSDEQYCESWWGPSGMYVDEAKDEVNIITYRTQKEYVIRDNKIIKERKIKYDFDGAPYVLKEYVFGTISNGCSLSIRKGDDKKNFIRTGSGVCFILKKDDGYIVYYVDEDGIPGAVDTEGKIFTNKEAIAYLKKYDSEKYAESLARAEELGLKELFLNAEVLVWGKTYYSTLYLMTEYWKGNKDAYLFVKISDKIQYDLQGNAYQLRLSYGASSKLVVVSPDGKWIFEPLELNNYSKELTGPVHYAYATWCVGFGGNIYYMVAGNENTEVFRIRRTWGDPDFYAMAINGYTEDEYGKYVDEVLPTLSKSDLRLLRNTIFALYGVHFKSQDLSIYFDKQVWYTDEGKTSAEVQLPEHRQKLVEMIQNLEK